MPCSNNSRPRCNTAHSLHNSRGGFGDRVIVNAKRVFDACMQQFAEEDATLTVMFDNATPPYTFVSGQNMGANIDSVTTIPIPGSPCSRIKLDLSIPIQIHAIDSTGAEVVGTASVAVSKDVILRVPNSALTPATVDVTATVVVLDGIISNETTLDCTVCYTIIIKIVADVDLIVPTAGYPIISECEEYSEDVCSGVFAQPVYPSAR